MVKSLIILVAGIVIGVLGVFYLAERGTIDIEDYLSNTSDEQGGAMDRDDTDGSMTDDDGNMSVDILCSDELRNADACTEIYQPVCAKVQVECITTPCDPVEETISNVCEACRNPRTLSYTEGECVAQ